MSDRLKEAILEAPTTASIAQRLAGEDQAETDHRRHHAHVTPDLPTHQGRTYVQKHIATAQRVINNPYNTV